MNNDNKKWRYIYFGKCTAQTIIKICRGNSLKIQSNNVSGTLLRRITDKTNDKCRRNFHEHFNNKQLLAAQLSLS